MPSDKDRLYIALYARGGSAKMPGLEDTYHWGFILGPKDEDGGKAMGARFHAMERAVISGTPPEAHSVWNFEERPIAMRPTAMLLVRVVVAKVVDKNRLVTILRGIPIRSDVAGWNCVGWVREALEVLVKDGRALGTSAKSWETVRDVAMSYVARKKAEHRFDGKGVYNTKLASTWDMLEDKELIP
ncbi:hypothetical protein GGR57DRAFT_333268 [Xylariaceae sp. FL1272]|nr:hypothetical protein GGR57DRAFT_333268 [Xylariaceae sp. FL1272]